MRDLAKLDLSYCDVTDLALRALPAALIDLGPKRSLAGLVYDSEHFPGHNPETPDFLLAIFREFSIISLCSVISRQCFAVHLFNTYGDAALEGWGIRCLRIVAGIMFRVTLHT